MNSLSYKRIVTNLSIIILIFLIDRLTKIYVINLAESLVNLNIPLTNFLNIILVWNSGIGFGLFQLDERIAYNAVTILIYLSMIFLLKIHYTPTLVWDMTI